MHFSTLPDVRAARAADAPALRDDAVVLTNAQLLERVQQAARALADHGIGRGDVVAVFLPNRVELLVALFAAWRLGAVVTPINPVLGPAEVGYQVSDATAQLLVAESERADLDVPTLTLATIAGAELGEVADPPIVEGLSESDLGRVL